MTTIARLVATLAALALTFTLAGPAGAEDVPVVEDVPVAIEPEPVPILVAPPSKPRDRFDVDKRRSCKREARVMKRVEITSWNLAETYANDVTVQFWEPQFSSLGWDRVLPTPRGCVLRHREWARHHGGKR
jgi:hypothetical protein